MEVGSSNLASGHALLNLMQERETLDRMAMDDSHHDSDAPQQRIRQIPELDLSKSQLHRVISDEHLERAASLEKAEQKKRRQQRRKTGFGDTTVSRQHNRNSGKHSVPDQI